MFIDMQKNLYIPNDPHECGKELIWITDIHEDACSPEKMQKFLSKLKHNPASTILIGGDTSNGHKSFEYLKRLYEHTHKNIYFVLGNHDYYTQKIGETRQKAQEINTENSALKYLTNAGVIPLSDKTALIGHDGWADGRIGNFLQSTISLSDYSLIEDLNHLEGAELLAKLNELGDEAAQSLENTLHQAFTNFSQVIVLTHVPPFREVCCYEGKICDDNWGPHFVCVAMGQMILSVAKKHPNKEVLLLCGHSHSDADVQIAPNIRAVAGDVVLGEPAIQATIHFA
jgi:predicted MPP superfamily phosphohydrolase